MNKRLAFVLCYFIYLFSVRVLLNIFLKDWLVINVGYDVTGSLIWGLIKFIHWTLPLFIYFVFIEKNLFEFIKSKFNTKIEWWKLIVFLIVWAILIIIQRAGVIDEPSAYTIIHDILITALVEEFVFRGFILDELKKVYNFTTASIIQSILFSLIHLPWLYSIGVFENPLTLVRNLIFYIAFGIIAAYLVNRSKSLIPSILLHAVNNFFA